MTVPAKGLSAVEGMREAGYGRAAEDRARADRALTVRRR